MCFPKQLTAAVAFQDFKSSPLKSSFKLFYVITIFFLSVCVFNIKI